MRQDHRHVAEKDYFVPLLDLILNGQKFPDYLRQGGGQNEAEIIHHNLCIGTDEFLLIRPRL